MLPRKGFLLPVQGFQRVFQSLKVLFSGLHPRFQQGNLLLHLHQGQPVRAVAEASQQILLFAHGFIALLDRLQLPDLLRRILDPLAHASVEDHALLHVLDVDVLLHADIFLHEILQADVHAEGDGALEQSGEFFHVKAAQIHLVQVPAEPLVIGGGKPFVLREIPVHPGLQLRGGHGADLSGVFFHRKRAAACCRHGSFPAVLS